jgi:hypothetical protein
MINELRQHYNKHFSQQQYEKMLQQIETHYQCKIPFRVAETPLFVPDALKKHLINACNEIIDVIVAPDFKEKSKNAVPPQQNVPNEDAHTQLLAIDFAVCRNENGDFFPQLIELQGFPSLYGFQAEIGKAYKNVFHLPDHLQYYFNDLNEESYINLLREIIVGKHQPENVILLEIEPLKQKTSIDFFITQKMLGIAPVCISEVIQEGKKLFYLKDGKKTPIYRIYNRIIFDELVQRTDLKLGFQLTDDVAVEWAGHPNWFFRISKHTLPLLKSKYVPETHYLSNLQEIPTDLENYVLKPLFSFAGQGVMYHVKAADIAAIEDKSNYILQRKVQYTNALETPEGNPVKAEIRMLFLWREQDTRPTLATSLVRLSQGVMMGVNFNKNFTWVGGSTAYFM